MHEHQWLQLRLSWSRRKVPIDFGIQLCFGTMWWHCQKWVCTCSTLLEHIRSIQHNRLPIGTAEANNARKINDVKVEVSNYYTAASPTESPTTGQPTTHPTTASPVPPTPPPTDAPSSSPSMIPTSSPTTFSCSKFSNEATCPTATCTWVGGRWKECRNGGDGGGSGPNSCLPQGTSCSGGGCKDCCNGASGTGGSKTCN